MKKQNSRIQHYTANTCNCTTHVPLSKFWANRSVPLCTDRLSKTPLKCQKPDRDRYVRRAGCPMREPSTERKTCLDGGAAAPYHTAIDALQESQPKDLLEGKTLYVKKTDTRKNKLNSKFFSDLFRLKFDKARL